MVQLSLSAPPTEPSPWYGPWVEHPEGLVALGVAFLFLLLAGIVLLRRLPSHLRARKRPTLEPMQLEQMMLGNPPRILDLRTEAEYRSARGHIRGAENIPFAQLVERLDEITFARPGPVVLVDETDKLGHLAAPLMIERGHPWLYVLKGGMRAWRREKLPLYVFEDGRPTRA